MIRSWKVISARAPRKLGCWEAGWWALSHHPRTPVPWLVGLGPQLPTRLGACVQSWALNVERCTFSPSFFRAFSCLFVAIFLVSVAFPSRSWFDGRLCACSP